MNRRKFLLGASAFSLSLNLEPASAILLRRGLPAATSSGFNGGKSQGQSSLNAGSSIGDFPFINMLKQAAGYQGGFSPSSLDSNGYPTPAGIAADGQFTINMTAPGQTEKPATPTNPFVVTWIGNSSISIGNNTRIIVSGSTAAVLNGYGFSDGLYHGRYEWYPDYVNGFISFDGTYPFQFNITSVTGSINNLAMYYLSDETDYLAGKYFAPDFKRVVQQAKFGVFRFMDWINENGNMTTWATRKSINYPTWYGDEYRASMRGGVAASTGTVKAALSSLTWSAGVVTATTSSPHGFTSGKNFPVRIYGVTPSGYNISNPSTIGDVIGTSTGASTFTYPLASNPGTMTAAGTYSANCLDYTLAVSGSYVWTNPVQGNYAGGAAVDKQTMHMQVGADCMQVQNCFSNKASTGTLTITNFSPITFNWPSLPLSNGDPVCVSVGFVGGNLMQGVAPNQTYYVVNVSGNTFQISLTPGGSAVSSTDTSGDDNTFVTRLSTLNINSTSAVPVWLSSVQAFVSGPANCPVSTNGNGSPIYSTLTYDADLNSWLMFGGASSAGLQNGIPFEVCLELCAELGMHPHLSIAGYALDPATDLVTSLASYIKTTYQNGSATWMVPRFEPGNEVWNTALGINVTPYCQAKAYNHWQIYTSDLQGVHQEYGKWASVMGQGLATVFGKPNLGVTYEVMVGGKYVSVVTDQTERLLASAYVHQAAPAQSGYAKQSAADGTTINVSVVTVANYTNPTMRGAVGELQNAWLYYNGPSAGSDTYLSNYVNTLPGGSNPAPAWYAGTKAWGAQYGVNKMHAYEGGYSPDLVPGAPDWSSSITGATAGSTTVLTLATFNSTDQAGGGSGNPAELGMVLSIQGTVGGISGISVAGNTNVTLTEGSASIPYAGNSLVAGQGIIFYFAFFTPSPFSNIKPGVTYYVSATGLSSSAFQISATKGGSVLTPAGAGTGVTWTATMASGWVVTNVSGNSVTIDCSTTGTYTSGGFAIYSCSGGIVNNFRVQCLYSPSMYTKTMDNYNAWTAAGGTFPSQYEISGTGSIWPPIQPDIFGAQSQEFAAIVAYNL